MSWEPKTGWVVVVVLAGLVTAWLLVRAPRALEPEPVGLYVAIEPQGSGVARVGPVEIEAGTPFRLFAVLAAQDWRGREIFFTEAPALEVRGRLVEPGLVNAWSGGSRPRLLWFSVEAAPPFLAVSAVEQVEAAGYREVFRADWPQAWSIPGRLDPVLENVLPGREDVARDERFGVQRYHVRLELFAGSSTILPTHRVRSPGVDELLSDPGAFPAVTAVLPGGLEPLSRAFGLPQIEAGESAPVAVRAAVGERVRRGLAFSRVPLLARWLDFLGGSWADLEWQQVEIAGQEPWGAAGDVLRAGSKVAFAYRDRGAIGRLDDEDWCLDFDRGATVRTLGEIFVGEGLIERADGAPPADAKERPMGGES